MLMMDKADFALSCLSKRQTGRRKEFSAELVNHMGTNNYLRSIFQCKGG